MIAITGLNLPEGIISFDAPVTVNDSLVFSCLDSCQGTAEELNLPGKWSSDNFGSSLPVHITIPDKPGLILFIINSSNEIQGYLLSCSDQGDIIDSFQVYYWNSDGFESWESELNTDGSIIRNIHGTAGLCNNASTTVYLAEDGRFTMTSSPLKKRKVPGCIRENLPGRGTGRITEID